MRTGLKEKSLMGCWQVYTNACLFRGDSFLQLGTAVAQGHDNKDRTCWKRMGVVLVAGATGGVGKRVVQQMVERSYQVRALVRDADKAGRYSVMMELVVGDITKQNFNP